MTTKNRENLKPLAAMYFNLGVDGTLKIDVDDVTLPPYSPADVQVVMKSATLLRPPGICESCERVLTKPDGYAGTGLCGPCATGEFETLAERGDTW